MQSVSKSAVSFRSDRLNFVMPEIDIERLVLIVTGVQLNAELGDRALAYKVKEEMTAILARIAPPGEDAASLVPVVVSDVYYLNSEPLQTRPVLSIGGPGVNALSAMLVDKLPTVVAIENVLVIQMDLEMSDPRATVWGMNHLDTVRAVELFVARNYLEVFVRGCLGGEGDNSDSKIEPD